MNSLQNTFSSLVLSLSCVFSSSSSVLRFSKSLYVVEIQGTFFLVVGHPSAVGIVEWEG